LQEQLKLSGPPAIAVIETRMLTQHLCEKGTFKGCMVAGDMSEADAVDRAREDWLLYPALSTRGRRFLMRLFRTGLCSKARQL